MIVAAGCIAIIVLITILAALTFGLGAGGAVAVAATLGFVVGISVAGKEPA